MDIVYSYWQKIICEIPYELSVDLQNTPICSQLCNPKILFQAINLSDKYKRQGKQAKLDFQIYSGYLHVKTSLGLSSSMWPFHTERFIKITVVYDSYPFSLKGIDMGETTVICFTTNWTYFKYELLIFFYNVIYCHLFA